MGALIVIGAALGLAKGLGNVLAAQTEYEEKVSDLEQTQKELSAQFDNSVANAAADVEEANKRLEANIADTTVMRNERLGTSANSIAMQEQIQAQQIAELQLQAADARGAAIQDTATSGVRLMRDADGNVVNAGVYRAEKAGERSLSAAIAQRNLSRYQNIESARANYLQANMNLAAYQREIAYNGTVERDSTGKIIGGTGKFGREYNAYKLTYDQQYNRNQKELDYIHSDEYQNRFFWIQAGNLFSGIVGGAASFA